MIEDKARATTNSERTETCTAGIGSLVLDKDLKVKFHTIKDIRDEIIGLPIDQVEYFAGCADFKTCAQRAMQTENSVESEVFMPGKQTPTQITCSHFTDAKGEADGVIFTFVSKGADSDVERLKSSIKSHYLEVFKSTVNVMIIFDFDGNILDQNHVSPGISFEDIKGHGWKKFSSSESVKEIEDRLNKVKATNESEIFEISVQAPDGRTVHYWNSMTPLEVEGGVRACLSTAVDITELRLTQKALNESSKQKERLTQSNEDLEQFAYVASHDLQEPIRIVSQYLQLLERHLGDNLDDVSKKYMDFAVDASNRMRDLINGLLEFARMNSQELNTTVVDGNQLLSSVVNFAELKIQEVQASVNVGDFPEMVCDPILCRQLLQNLLSNALKFRDPERPIEIELSYSSDQSNHIISVQDNGIGVDNAQIDRMFMIFKRGHSKKQYPGHGIGLTLGKRIVERHGGVIWIESELGKGTKVSFSLPKNIQIKKGNE